MHELEKHKLACKEKSILKNGKYLEGEIEVQKRQLKMNSKKLFAD